MEKIAVEIRRAALEEIIDLRHAVLRKGLPRREAYLDGDDVGTTVHLAAVESGKVVGCASVLVALLKNGDSPPARQLRGMAVDPGWQRRGVGRKLVEEAVNVARRQGARVLWANARTPAVGFYRMLGWEVISEEFDIPLAGPHFRMVYRLG